MHWVQSICVMEPPSSNNPPITTTTLPWKSVHSRFPLGEIRSKVPSAVLCAWYLHAHCVCLCVHVFLTCVCVYMCQQGLASLLHTSVHMKILPFYDYVRTVAYTTTSWQRYCDKGYLSATWGQFYHSFCSPSWHSIRHFPRGSLSLLPSAGMKCILIN